MLQAARQLHDKLTSLFELRHAMFNRQHSSSSRSVADRILAVK